jgi:hypothetical protein
MLEHAARAAMVAEYREPPAARRTRSEWLIAVPAMAFVAAIVAFVLLGWAIRA